MATKKNTAAPATKPEEKKAATAEVKAEAAKPEVKVETAPAKKEATKPAAKKEAAKPAAKKEPAKPAAKSAPAKKTAKPATKKAPKKAKTITADDVVAKVAKLIDNTKAKKVDGKVAMDIKLYGTFEAHMYIEVKDGVATVAPYDYVEKDLEAAVSVENALAIADGKLAIKDAIADGRLYINGNLTYVMKLASILK